MEKLRCQNCLELFDKYYEDEDIQKGSCTKCGVEAIRGNNEKGQRFIDKYIWLEFYNRNVEFCNNWNGKLENKGYTIGMNYTKEFVEKIKKIKERLKNDKSLEM